MGLVTHNLLSGVIIGDYTGTEHRAVARFGTGLDTATVSAGSAALQRLTTETSDPRITLSASLT